MSGLHGRVIVDGPFDRTLWWVIEALAGDGFAIRPTRDGNPPGNTSRDWGKHILLEATPPCLRAEVHKADPKAGDPQPCRIAVYELSANRTAVVVPDAVVPATADRITRALNAVAHRQAPSMAFA